MLTLRVLVAFACVMMSGTAFAEDEAICLAEEDLISVPEVLEPEPEEMTCAYGGYWTCPDPFGEIYEYGPAPVSVCLCGPTRTTAYAQCDANCTGQCYDSGWVVPCN